MITPHKRSIMEANNTLFHRVSSDDPPSAGGLRRRRIGSRGTNDGAGAPSSSDINEIDRSPPPSPSSPPPPHREQTSVVPLSMHLMRPFWHMSCGPDCYPPPSHGGGGGGGGVDRSFEDEFFLGNVGHNNNNNNNNIIRSTPPRRIPSMNGRYGRIGDGGAIVARGEEEERSPNPNGRNGSTTPSRGARADASYPDRHSPVSSVSSYHNATPLPPPVPFANDASIEQILREYSAACTIYGCASRMNPGVLTALRFSLPTLRVSGNFFDADMLALAEVLLMHCNGALRHVRRLDFTIAGKEGKDRGGAFGGGSGKKGVRSHGAYALSRVLCASEFVEEVYLSRNRIGPYGSSAVFRAATENARRGGRLRTLRARGCRIGERGGMAFAEEMRKGAALTEVDLSSNRIGFQGCFEIEKMLKERADEDGDGSMPVLIDLEGNMVFQEVMNCVTHGLGILLGTLGTRLLHKQVADLPPHYRLSCAIYSASIITLYTSSTLFHSFFALKKTKFIFQVFDKCAIYLLIAGSYSPFLMIALHHEPLWSLHLLLFIWACAVSGIFVEAMFKTWKHKSKFSLAMYLGMGWSCLVCLQDLVEVLPMEALVMIMAGGVAYTGGVPFFVRNNNLDHSIWHMFVLAGSVIHWLCVYWYVAIPPKEGSMTTVGM